MARIAKQVSLRMLDGGKPHRSNKEINQRKKAEENLKPKSDSIKRPTWLGKDKLAKKEWKLIASNLEEIELLTNVDVTALAIYCQAVSRYVELNKDIEVEGATTEYTNVAGETNIIENPKVGAAQKYYKIIKDMLKEFGLTPAARASLAIHKKEEPKEDLTAKFGV